MIPSSITISGRIFSVEVVEELEDIGQMGESDYELSYIKIKETNEKSMQATLLHEVVHMALAHAGLGELLLGISDTCEEAVVCAVENGIAPIYSLNGSRARKAKK